MKTILAWNVVRSEEKREVADERKWEIARKGIKEWDKGERVNKKARGKK